MRVKKIVKIIAASLLVFAALIVPAVQTAQVCKRNTEGGSITPSTPTTNFIDHGDTVTDTTTGLMWAKCTAGLSGAGCAGGTIAPYNWQAALAYAAASALAGHTNWRLPNINELLSIVEEACYSPAINTTIFPNTPSSDFWSASPFAYYSNYAWVVFFSNGYDGDYNRGNGRYVRLVRGGQ